MLLGLAAPNIAGMTLGSFVLPPRRSWCEFGLFAGCFPVKPTACSYHRSWANLRDGFSSTGQVALGLWVGGGLGRAGFAAGF